MKFSLIIPCYNEAANLPLLIERCSEMSKNPKIEIILVDNGSIDHSAQVLQDILPKYPEIRSVRVEQNQGYGFGILFGLNKAQGDILGWTHADMQTDPEDLLEGMKLFKKHGNNIFVKGRRFGRPISDVFFTVGMGVFESLLLGKSLWDINAQPTLFSKPFFQSWANPPNDFSLDLYAYYQAHCHKLAIKRFPVKFNKRVNGSSHWNINWSAKKKFIRRTLDFSLELKKGIKS